MREIYITDNVVVYNDMERGWVTGKCQPSWHERIYDMWRNMWKRVYSNVYYFGSLIHPSFKYLSNYVKWIESQPRFEEFCATCNKTKWSIDKDSKHLRNKNYYPECMTLMLGGENSIECINRNGHLNTKQAVLGVPLDDTNKITLAISHNDVSNYGFNQSAVSRCLAKIRKSHKGYRWYKVNYKHNKIYRIKRR